MDKDIISRQAAIDAIYETFCYAYCDNCEKEMNEDLCGDCHRKYQNWAASKKIISKTINSLPSAGRQRRWIPVTERLPEERGAYLVSGKWANKDSEVWICEFVRLYNWGWCNAAERPVVQAWMPLPSPYQEGE